jgi:protein MpaA
VIGHSVRGRAIVARRWGDRRAERSVLVVGSIHGDETQGHRVVKELTGRRAGRLDRVELWTIETMNPDGVAAHRRGNAHGVDLNRNFPYQWRSIPPSSGYYSGPRPASEPETRAALRFLRDKRPTLTIWYHQPWGEVLVPCNRPSRKVALRYSKLSGLPPSDGCHRSPPGAATGWQRHALEPKAFVVEFAGGGLSPSQVRRHARAVAEIAEPG